MQCLREPLETLERASQRGCCCSSETKVFLDLSVPVGSCACYQRMWQNCKGLERIQSSCAFCMPERLNKSLLYYIAAYLSGISNFEILILKAKALVF